MRDLPGFSVTRQNLLQCKPSLKLNWLAVCVSKHLLQDYEGAVRVIDIYLGTLEDGSPELRRNYEPSELALYKNTILGEVDPTLALQHLQECQGIVMDRGAWLTLKAKYELELEDFDAVFSTSAAVQKCDLIQTRQNSSQAGV